MLTYALSKKSKMECGSSNSNFKPKNKVAALRLNYNRVVSVMAHFQETKSVLTVKKVNGYSKQVKIPMSTISSNKHENRIDLFDNNETAYFASIQVKYAAV
ncbi:hypothetical protein NPIL_8781 [Nephila pilipes]|uniref:Uncharacterized protein n=1 Tax=Nephila pilipes TaxID=299642 RepID=A0A8X6TNY1_NEPPI|nr:hypothetical protein NPIL_8781 [Nephila pilipes]